jgi:hypothetical protein
LRDKLLAPIGMKFDAPNKVSLYLLGSNIVAIENFNDTEADVTLGLPVLNEVKKILILPEDAKMVLTSYKNNITIKDLSKITCGFTI